MFIVYKAYTKLYEVNLENVRGTFSETGKSLHATCKDCFEEFKS